MNLKIENKQFWFFKNTEKRCCIRTCEIGKPILKLLSKNNIVVGFDINPNLMDEKKFEFLIAFNNKNLQCEI